MKDQYGRTIEYLRLSVTDRCDLRCRYCMPESGVDHMAHTEVLTFEEIHRIVSLFAQNGLKKVRITGGEPLVRQDLPDLVSMLKGIGGLEQIALTTNGSQLATYAKPLKDAGLTRVNISLDTVDPLKFQWLTRGGDLSRVLAGIQQAKAAGLTPVRLNAVLLKGFNHDEVDHMIRFAKRWGLTLRLIEQMPIGDLSERVGHFMDGRQLLAQLGIDPMTGRQEGVATYYVDPSTDTEIGLIRPMTAHFCGQCDRLRLSADGVLRACLLEGGEMNVKQLIRSGAGDREVLCAIQKLIEKKPANHRQGSRVGGKVMSQIGG